MEEQQSAIGAIINKAVRDFEEKKMQIFLQRIAERVPQEFLPIDLNKEMKRLFPRIAKVQSYDLDSEHWYWNDGTENGLHIVSFIKDDSPQDWTGSDNKMIFSITMKYK